MVRLEVDWALLEGASRILVAYSGGVDSTLLLYLLVQRFGPEVCVAVYLDHGLRASDVLQAERHRVRQTAMALGVMLVIRKLPMRAYAKRYGTGMEESGRYLRYAYLAHFRRRYGCDMIVTAHHADDGLESGLMQLGQGALWGIRGVLPEMVWQSDHRVCHPFWRCRKTDIIDTARAWQVSYTEDLTNADTRMLRNRVRHQLIPTMTTVFPDFSDKLQRLSSWIGALSTYVWSHVPARLQVLSLRDEGQGSRFWHVSLSGFFELQDIEKQILVRQWLMQVGSDRKRYVPGPSLRFSAHHVLDVVAVASGTKTRCSLPQDYVATRVYETLYFQKKQPLLATQKPEQSDTAFLLTVVLQEGRVVLGETGLVLEISRVRHLLSDPFLPMWRHPSVGCFSTRQMPQGTVLTCRARQPGDRIHPFGMAYSVSLKKYMAHRKIPARWRGEWPLFFCGSEIVWVPFLCLSESYRVGSVGTGSVQEDLWVVQLSPCSERWRTVFDYYEEAVLPGVLRKK